MFDTIDHREQRDSIGMYEKLVLDQWSTPNARPRHNPRLFGQLIPGACGTTVDCRTAVAFVKNGCIIGAMVKLVRLKLVRGCEALIS